jgi:hypothetical protein
VEKSGTFVLIAAGVTFACMALKLAQSAVFGSWTQAIQTRPRFSAVAGMSDAANPGNHCVESFLFGFSVLLLICRLRNRVPEVGGRF